MKDYFLGFVLITLFLGCSEEEPDVTIDQALVEYFSQFAEEAHERGLIIDWDEESIGASLTKIEEDAVGQCLTYTEGVRKINIDQDYWAKSSVMEREFLIFHELGHCILERPHLNESYVNGTCISIMSSGENSCNKNYNSITRARYLDELFSEI